jgi:hypothetical protein
MKTKSLFLALFLAVAGWRNAWPEDRRFALQSESDLHSPFHSFTHQQSTKTKNSTGEVPMPAALEERLRAFLKHGFRENPNRYLFANRNGSTFSVGKVTEYGLWPMQDALGIPHTGTHAFRHAAASELLEEGAPLTVVHQQLRHGDAKTTLQKYGHVVGDSQRRAVNTLAEKIERQDLHKPPNQRGWHSESIISSPLNANLRTIYGQLRKDLKAFQFVNDTKETIWDFEPKTTNQKVGCSNHPGRTISSYVTLRSSIGSHPHLRLFCSEITGLQSRSLRYVERPPGVIGD